MFSAIIIGIILFMFLVIVHELGHFIAAKKSGVKVHEFGIGIPPKAFTIYTDKSGTEYTFNRVLLGGFVRMKGENPEDTQSFHAKDSFITQNLFKKIIILIGGVAVNLFFARVFFSIAFASGIKPLNIIPDNMTDFQSDSYIVPSKTFAKENGLLTGKIKAIPVKVEGVLKERGIAQKIGIQTGDIIQKINGKKVDTLSLQNKLKKNIGKEISITIKRDGEKIEKTAKCGEYRCLLGIIMKQGGNIEVLNYNFGILKAMGIGAHELRAQTKLTFNALGNIFGRLLTFDQEKAKEAVEQLAGPVGAVKVGQVILNQFGYMQYIAFGGMISMALAIFNILPIPALDGGRMISVIIQSISKAKPEGYFIIENYINVIFFILLMGLGIYIIFQDLARFWGVNPFGM